MNLRTDTKRTEIVRDRSNHEPGADRDEPSCELLMPVSVPREALDTPTAAERIPCPANRVIVAMDLPAEESGKLRDCVALAREEGTVGEQAGRFLSPLLGGSTSCPPHCDGRVEGASDGRVYEVDTRRSSHPACHLKIQAESRM